MRHIADVVGKQGVLSLEFSSSAVCRSLGLCLQEGKNLVMIALARCSRDFPVVKGIVKMVAQLLSVVSTCPTIFCSGGADKDFIKALDRDPTRKSGVQYPLTFSPVQLEKLMHKLSFNFMRKIDKFSMLRTLFVRLSGRLEGPGAQSTRFSRKVGFFATKCNNHV